MIRASPSPPRSYPVLSSTCRPSVLLFAPSLLPPLPFAIFRSKSPRRRAKSRVHKKITRQYASLARRAFLEGVLSAVAYSSRDKGIFFRSAATRVHAFLIERGERGDEERIERTRNGEVARRGVLSIRRGTRELTVCLHEPASAGAGGGGGEG